jgi:hypothetical protein
MPQSEKTSLKCRLANTSASEKSGLSHFDFCAFAFPRCDGCPNAPGPVNDIEAIDDPMKSDKLDGWLGGLQKPC